MTERRPRGARGTPRSTPESFTVRLHEQDVERIAAAVVAAIRRERAVDDIARSIQVRLREVNRETEPCEKSGPDE